MPQKALWGRWLLKFLKYALSELTHAVSKGTRTKPASPEPCLAFWAESQPLLQSLMYHCTVGRWVGFADHCSPLPAYECTEVQRLYECMLCILE